jgi:hypothetical protein
MRRLFCAILLAVGSCNAASETYQLQKVPDLSVPGVSVDAKQRFVWTPKRPVRFLESEIQTPTGNQYIYAINQQDIVCAEPSPDAVSAFAASLSAKLGVALQKVDVNAEMARSITETVQQLTQRTEILQLLRDGYYRACEAYANGMMGEFGYGLMLNQLDSIIMKSVALNVVGQQRPLPENATDRQALANEPAQKLLLVSAQRRLQDARVALATVDERLVTAGLTRDEAEAARAKAETLRDQLKDPAGKTDAKDADKKALRDAEADLAEKTKRRDLAAIRATDAGTAHDAANKEVTDDVAEVKTLETAAATAMKTAAAVVQPPFAMEGFQTIEHIISQQSGHTTVTGACLMWFSQHLDVRAAPTPGEPAIAAACRGFLGWQNAAFAPNPGEAAMMSAIRQAEGEVLQQMLNETRQPRRKGL